MVEYAVRDFCTENLNWSADAYGYHLTLTVMRLSMVTLPVGSQVKDSDISRYWGIYIDIYIYLPGLETRKCERTTNDQVRHAPMFDGFGA